MHAPRYKRTERRHAALGLGHLARPIDEEVVVHPDVRAGLGRFVERLVLRDLVAVVDFAVIDPAGMDIELLAEIFDAHHRAFEMPARRARPPRREPFHLAMLARRRLAPDREVGGVALALDRLDPPDLRAAVLTGEAAIIGHLGNVEIEAAVEFIGRAMIL